MASASVGESDNDSAALLELVELADLVDICGQGNRAIPFTRDLVARFYSKSVTQGFFFRDVRMTPAHFDEPVALTTPHLPSSLRGPKTMPPAHRIFAVLFWLAQGGKQRVIARAVEVAESTFGKHCAPVIHAMLAGLPKPVWPGCAERRVISQDFAQLIGGNAVGWRGLYVSSCLRTCLYLVFATAYRWRCDLSCVQFDANDGQCHEMPRDGIHCTAPLFPPNFIRMKR